MTAREMTPEQLAEVRSALEACIDGGRGFQWGPCHPEGGFDSPEEVSAYVANLVRRSAEAATFGGEQNMARELWGVFVDREDESLFVCHTGNGPTSQAHARFIAGAPWSVQALLAHVDALTARLEAAERERDEARRMLERATPWHTWRPSEPTTEEMRAIRSRWGIGPEKYQADADALICGIMHARERADAAEAKLAALVEAATQAVFDTVAAQVFGDNGHDAAIRALDAAIAAARSKP